MSFQTAEEARVPCAGGTPPLDEAPRHEAPLPEALDGPPPGLGTGDAPLLDEASPYCRCDTLVLGCGNELFGDDGFGPAVARLLEGLGSLPEGMIAVDVGSSVRQVLFDVVLGPARPHRIIVVDAVDKGREPGEVWTIPASELPLNKCDDFSMHQVPTSNLLRELSELAAVDVRCVVAQVSSFPPEVRPGLSEPVRRAVKKAAQEILAPTIRQERGNGR